MLTEALLLSCIPSPRLFQCHPESPVRLTSPWTCLLRPSIVFFHSVINYWTSLLWWFFVPWGVWFIQQPNFTLIISLRFRSPGFILGPAFKMEVWKELLMVFISVVSRGRLSGESEGVAFPRVKRLLCLNGILPASVSHPPSLSKFSFEFDFLSMYWVLSLCNTYYK